MIPMLTFQNYKLEFDVKFTDYKCVDFNKKDNGGETGLDNGDRVAGNMYSFLNARFQLIRGNKFLAIFVCR